MTMWDKGTSMEQKECQTSVLVLRFTRGASPASFPAGKVVIAAMVGLLVRWTAVRMRDGQAAQSEEDREQANMDAAVANHGEGGEREQDDGDNDVHGKSPMEWDQG